MNLVLGNFQRREQEIISQLKVAFRVAGRNTAFIRPKKMDIIRQGWRAGGPKFSRLGLSHDRGKKLLRYASAGQCDAIWLARAAGQFNFIQPRAGDMRGQFIGSGKGYQLYFFHFIIWGSCQIWLLCASRSSDATGPHVPAE